MNEIPLFQKIYDLYKAFYLEVDNLPKKSEALATKTENTIINVLEVISKASFATAEEKTIGLKAASIKTDFLKVLFRLCFDIRIINQKKYIYFEERLQEIGRMIGGWQRSIKQ